MQSDGGLTPVDDFNGMYAGAKYRPIWSTARRKTWAALCGTFCMETLDANAAHVLLRAVLEDIFAW
jgi:hypothetical protein